MPPGVGQGQNVGLRDFCHILTLLPPWTSVFHKHMSSFDNVLMMYVEPYKITRIKHFLKCFCNICRNIFKMFFKRFYVIWVSLRSASNFTRFTRDLHMTHFPIQTKSGLQFLNTFSVHPSVLLFYISYLFSFAYFSQSSGDVLKLNFMEICIIFDVDTNIDCDNKTSCAERSTRQKQPLGNKKKELFQHIFSFQT